MSAISSVAAGKQSARADNPVWWCHPEEVTRSNPRDVHPRIFKRLLALNDSVARAAEEVELDLGVVELVKVRASLINGCAYCADMHATGALEAGITHRQLGLVTVWAETDLFSTAQRAALELAEAVSRLSQTQQVPEEIYRRAAEAFTEDQLSVLIWAASVIQVFNALNVTGQTPLPRT